ncbi:3'(2'),5'-bisphosphate nucleotidase CysQ [Actinokineospora bangkokensis]|uniref:3'(2'),5'-bisphosphate nucleotidase CysQ n=1 Tax=Actinokineospora bangkokensis TaxID=1193682 RepID=A0A1Q9LFN2_9PSEU|nr:3'(2'),5'-bisphosphate nucleotidase CysQ [Actinokineospora bangkokensis]OLR90833.1 3'(2'),5'-bisphosphate nucleotidase CysQ [Actinokineospora bangkokensis]
MATDARLAADLATTAGEYLMRLRDDGGPDLRRRGDLGSNELILRRLATERPDDHVLSEESVDDPSRTGADRVWIIDPLDGTREYGIPGRRDWAVHVALWQRGLGLTAGAVAQPALGEVHATDAPPPLAPSPDRIRVLVSASRPPSFTEHVADAVDAEVLTMGSAGAKAMAVLRGDADAYLHAGGQYEWDSAAPVAVVQAAGLHASRVDGSPLLYNQPHPYLPDLVICRPELAAKILDALRSALVKD